ncbi:MAG: hypothetical protein Q9169_006693 [Polycauliona sp. 2 TL-2023]
MSAYIPSLTSLVSTTTSRYTSALRQRITTTSSENDDLYIDDPDSSHVSRVLRAYYKEQQKPLPAWLGVDPRDREKAQEAGGGAGGYLGSLRQRAAAASGGSNQGSSQPSRGSGGGLGEIWGDAGPQQQQQPEGSLRRAPGAGASLGGGRIAARRAVGSSGSLETGAVGGATSGARPLPSQRAGSYQNIGGASGAPVGGGSAQDRLRARLAGRMGSGSSAGSGDEGGGRRY